MQSNQYQRLIAEFFEEGTTQETLFTGLAAEVGEVMSERVDETRRGAERTEEILDELSDILWYVASIAEQRGSSLGHLMNHGVNKLVERKMFGKQEKIPYQVCVSCGGPAGDVFCGFCLEEE
jgi:NTP pyrophosphatase (non-canonical NTP hydrolase)